MSDPGTSFEYPPLRSLPGLRDFFGADLRRSRWRERRRVLKTWSIHRAGGRCGISTEPHRHRPLAWWCIPRRFALLARSLAQRIRGTEEAWVRAEPLLDWKGRLHVRLDSILRLHRLRNLADARVRAPTVTYPRNWR